MPQRIVDLDASKPIDTAAGEFRTNARSLIVLLGDFDAALNSQVRSVFARAVMPVAQEAGALILDDARNSGCAPLLAQAALEADTAPPIVGLIPFDRAAGDVDPNHELVLRLPAAWCAQVKYGLKLAISLAPDAAASRRVTAILCGGGLGETKAVLWCARHGWPIVVLSKTGGIADQIAGPSASGAPPVTDPDLREILETAAIFSTAVDGSVDDLHRILMGRIAFSSATFTDTLVAAWLRYDQVDGAAIVRQATFRRLQLGLIVLAVLAVLFAILTVAPLPAAFAPAVQHLPLHTLVILAPILLSIGAAYNSHFRDGNKWILLRGAAEAMKREIFRYRSQASSYSDAQCTQTSRESKLTAKISDIVSSLEQSEVNKTNLKFEAKTDDRRCTALTPEQYIDARNQDQIAFFERKTRRLSNQLTVMQVLILVAGGAGTFLAAIKLDVWVALATAVATALTAKLQIDQAETSLVQYNQALASLRNIEAWWKALSPWEKGRRNNIDLLVDQTEKTLEAETAGWVQQMQSALDKLTEKEPQSDAK